MRIASIPTVCASEPVHAPTADAQIVLQPHDNVLILRRPDWNTPRTVMLYGEVQFPGRYTLTSRDERMSDFDAGKTAALAEVRHLAEAAKEAAADLMSGVAGPPVPTPTQSCWWWTRTWR